MATDQATVPNQVATREASLAEPQLPKPRRALNRSQDGRIKIGNKVGNKVDRSGNTKKCNKKLAAQSQLKITSFMK